MVLRVPAEAIRRLLRQRTRNLGCAGPPYKVYAAGYERLLGGTDTLEEAIALLAGHLPREAPAS